MENDIYQVSEKYIKECNERLILAKTSLMLNAPFFGILISKLTFVPNNTWCRTLAVDGKYLYYNVEFIMGIENPTMRKKYEDLLKSSIIGINNEQIMDALNGLSDKNLVAALVHETLHCAYDHFLRMGLRDAKKWNRAADYAINQMIKRDPKLGEIRSSWLFNPEYDGMTAEQIYNILEDKESSGDDGGGGTLDQHDIPHYENEEQREKMKEYMQDFKEQMLGAAIAGNAPAEIERLLDELKESKIDWRTKLNRTLKSLIKNNVTYTRPSRRTWCYGTYLTPILPGMTPDEDIDICIALDASGSITSEMLSDFLSEVVGITNQYMTFKIRMLTFDTSVYEVHDYKNGDESEILNYPVCGGGGTSFNCVWDYMKNEKYIPKQLVMFTDGCPFGGWGDPTYCDTLFVIHSNPKVESPFGNTVHYEFNVKL